MPPHCVPFPKCVLPKRNHGHPDWLTCSAAEEGNRLICDPWHGQETAGSRCTGREVKQQYAALCPAKSWSHSWPWPEASQ